MPPHDMQATQRARQTKWFFAVDVLFRTMGIFLCGIFSIGALWAGRDGSYPNLTALSQALLMLLCALSSARPSRLMFIALVVALVLASIDFGIRGLPILQREHYPPDIVAFYLLELVIASWFIGKYIWQRLTFRADPTSDR